MTRAKAKYRPSDMDWFNDPVQNDTYAELHRDCFKLCVDCAGLNPRGRVHIVEPKNCQGAVHLP